MSNCRKHTLCGFLSVALNLLLGISLLSACSTVQPATEPVVEGSTEIVSTLLPSPTDDLENNEFASFNLPDGYRVRRLIESHNFPLMAQSQDGTLYLQEISITPSIYTLSSDHLELTKILNLPTEGNIHEILGGPDNSAFIQIASEVWQVFPDGRSSKIMDLPWHWVEYYAADGTLYGFNHARNEIDRIGRNGEVEVIAGDFGGICDIIVNADGVIFVSDSDRGQVVRVETSGEKNILVDGLQTGDPMHINFDPAGNLYLLLGINGFRRIDINTGLVTPLPAAYSPCAWNLNDFEFTSENDLIVVGGDEITWANLETGENGFLFEKGTTTFAADIGPDDLYYFGINGCGSAFPSKIYRWLNIDEQEVFVDGLSGNIADLAFDLEGGLYYVITNNETNNRLFYKPSTGETLEIPGVPQGELVSIAVDPTSGYLYLTMNRNLVVYEYDQTGIVAEYPVRPSVDIDHMTIEFAPNGSIYAIGVKGYNQVRTDRWIFEIDLKDASAEVLANFHREELGGSMNVINVDFDNMIWFIANPESIVYTLIPGQDKVIFASHLPIDMPAIDVDRTGNIYFDCSLGLFRIEPMR